MNAHSYGDWNLPYGELMGTFTQEEARRRDAAGQEYWVIFGDPENPSIVIHVADQRVWIKVVWLDELRRHVLSYLFVPEDKEAGHDPNGHLFLEQTRVTGWDHRDTLPDDRATSGFNTWFDHDGSFYAIVNEGDQGPMETTDSMDPHEAASVLWEPSPTFGHWDSITRAER